MCDIQLIPATFVQVEFSQQRNNFPHIFQEEVPHLAIQCVMPLAEVYDTTLLNNTIQKCTKQLGEKLKKKNKKEKPKRVGFVGL